MQIMLPGKLVEVVCQGNLMFIKLMEMISFNPVCSNKLKRNITWAEHAVNVCWVFMEPVRHLDSMLLTEKVTNNKMDILVVNKGFVPSVHFVILSWDFCSIRGRSKLWEAFNGSPCLVLVFNVVPDGWG